MPKYSNISLDNETTDRLDKINERLYTEVGVKLNSYPAIIKYLLTTAENGSISMSERKVTNETTH